MKIIVCVKQVPDTSGKVAVNPDGTLNRASMATITNPDDLNAVEAALALKDELGCKVVAVTMGPPPAEGMLRELMAMGVDEGVLVTAREFGGSDTFATSQIIAAGINAIGLEEDDIVFCGRQAIDGDTAQVGPQIAEKLNLPQVSYAGEITKDGKTLTVVLPVDVPYFTELCAFPAYMPVRKDLIEANGDAWATKAETYIGNGPNFMVKAIAEKEGVKMPSFFGYMALSLTILLPVYALVEYFVK